MASAVRGKRSSSKGDDSPAKKAARQQCSGSGTDDDDKIPWTLRPSAGFPTSSIYNCTSRSQPAELFRKDLISAMKLPDSEPLASEDFWLVGDPWRQEWEKGVQVPVNPEDMPATSVRAWRRKDKAKGYKMPTNYIRITHDEFFSNNLHHMSNAPAQAETMCRYDLDPCDVHWLRAFNEERAALDGSHPVEELTMETVMEELEVQCYENMQHAIQTEDGLGIEYDEDVICDVCRSPDSEDGNEMVFCDACNICVHQACYGITTIPAGSWLCCTCSLGIKPGCLFCPIKGGAMKSTRNGQKWSHVSCALWIPEVIIGCVEKMEPITQVSQVPPSRWTLVCCVCRERCGACIQCSVKSCKTAYHVTCGFQKGLEMKTLMEDVGEDDETVKFRSYCPKHSKRLNNDCNSSDSDDAQEAVLAKKRSRRKFGPKKEISLEEKANVRAERLLQIEADFFNYVSLKKLIDNLQVDKEVADFIFNYWKLKRKAAFNQPLIPPSVDDIDSMGREQDDSLNSRMKMFVHLRQDLERVRNLCYMVNRREKLSRSWCDVREEVFKKQVSVLTDPSVALSAEQQHKTIHAAHSTSIYDRLCAAELNCCENSTLAVKESPSKGSNGAAKCGSGKASAEKLPNPYAKTYLNGRSQRRSAFANEPGGTPPAGPSSHPADDGDDDLAEPTSASWKESRLHFNGKVKRENERGAATSPTLHRADVGGAVVAGASPTKTATKSNACPKVHGQDAERAALPTTSVVTVALDVKLKLERYNAARVKTLDKLAAEDGFPLFRGKENTCSDKHIPVVEGSARKPKMASNSASVPALSANSNSHSDGKHGAEDAKGNAHLSSRKAEFPGGGGESKATPKKKGEHFADGGEAERPTSGTPKQLLKEAEKDRTGFRRKQTVKEGDGRRNVPPKGTPDERCAETIARDDGKAKARSRTERASKRKTKTPRRSSESCFEEADGTASSVDVEISPDDKPYAKNKTPEKRREAENKEELMQKRKSRRLAEGSAKVSNGRYFCKLHDELGEPGRLHVKVERERSAADRKRESGEPAARKSHPSVTSLLGGYRIPKKTRSGSSNTDAESPPGADPPGDKTSPEGKRPSCNARSPGRSQNLPTTPEKQQTASSPSPQASPRLVLKLRKDPNYPESPRWRRDGDDDETAAAPEISPRHRETRVRCKLPWSEVPTPLGTPVRKMDRQQFRTYGMRSRAAVQDLHGKFSRSEPS